MKFGSPEGFAFYSCLLFHRDPQLLKRIGEATALEVRGTGIPYVFAPCLAVRVYDSCFRTNKFKTSMVPLDEQFILPSCVNRCAGTRDGAAAMRATVRILTLLEL